MARRGYSRGRLCLLTILSFALPASVLAHSSGVARAVPEDGLVIPGILHEQMTVIADNLPAIRAVADRQIPTDRVMRQLQGFVNFQSFACMWGIVPGSLSDEGSPFNECTHAYLAGAQALLIHLQDMHGGDRVAVRALGNKIELEMLKHNASLVMCRYSDEPFNTGDVIPPHWTEIPGHRPSLMTFGGVVLFVFGSIAILVGRRADRHQRR